MKVVYIIPYDWAGMPHYTAELANAVSNYAEVTVLGTKAINKTYFNENVKIIKAFEPLSFSTNYLKTLLNVKNIINMFSYKNINIICTLNPDVIHFTTPLPPPLSVFIKLYRIDKKFPIIYTRHTIVTDKRFKNKILETIEHSLEHMIHFKKWIVHTDVDKQMLISMEKINIDKISVIPHGSYSLFKSFKNNVQKEKNTILYFGRIAPYKGLEYLLMAIPKIVDEIPNVKAIIAGEGDITPYKSLINPINSKNIEIYNQYIPDNMVAELFQRSELLILPYTYMSGQSGVLNIACAYNMPVVATDVGSFNDVVVNGKSGFLVPPKNKEAISSAVTSILKDENLKKFMAENMNIKSNELSWDTIATKHILIYKDIMNILHN
jgi:glycosyltransferase involved in cell wall biosynthesis